jgi:hypothetical protein
MKITALLTSAALIVGTAVFIGCESTDGGGQSTVYYGSGFYDPWYHGDVYYDNDVVVTPPDRGDWGARPSHPIANPPSGGGGARPMPMPSVPTAMPRGGGGRR